jgi:hypothetical protein
MTTSSITAHPYKKFIGDRNPAEIIAATAGELKRLAEKLGPERVERSPAPGKWSPREIFCHLADAEIAHAFRLRQALAETHPTVQPWDQEKWAENYEAYSADAALAVFAALRKWNLALFKTLPAGAYERPLSHPERGRLTIQILLETMAGHDVNHLQQLERIAGL